MDPSKETIRFEAARHRDRIEINEDELEAAADHFMEKIKPVPGQVVGAYWPKGKEINPYSIIERLIENGIGIALPVVLDTTERKLGFAAWDLDVKLIRSKFGVMQPEITDKTRWVCPDILIVPLLAFDQRGFRLGYGGGYYDSTIRDLRAQKGITAVGLAYATQACIFNLPREEHDEKMDWIITPARTYKFC